MNTHSDFRVRFRFRVGKKLNIDSSDHEFCIGGRKAILSAPSPDVPISESDWLIINVRGFRSEQEARSFAHGLKVAIEISSVASRLGVDSGLDISTSALSQHIKQHLYDTQDVIIRDNVHGLDIFPNHPNVKIFSLSATASIKKSPSPFIEDLSPLVAAPLELSKNTRDIIILLNYALLRQDPVAQIVFAISAVEAVGQLQLKTAWSAQQREALKKAAGLIREDLNTSKEEREELALAVQNLKRASVNQGVNKLLQSLKLTDFKKDWQILYKDRGKLVHALAPEPGFDYSELANRAINICGRILLTSIAKEVPSVKRHVELFYPNTG